tara:strand:+ start:12 stop:776 length:765 start_codon:yes stop_codon:yes gene_type:complete
MEPKSSIIVGSSRATHGLNPEFILGGEISNFAFDAFSSPFSKVYNDAIYSFLGDSLKSKGTIVIEINPWTLSVDTSLAEPFRELDRVLNKGISFSNKPNYSFLFNNYDHGWGKIIMDEVISPLETQELHDNGWLEVSIDMSEASIKTRKNGLLAAYRKKAKKSVISNYRITSLIELVDSLNDFKKVVIVKLPVCSELLDIESTFYNEDSIYNLIKEGFPSMKFIEFDSIQWIDGHHVFKDEVEILSKRLSDSIE